MIALDETDADAPTAEIPALAALPVRSPTLIAELSTVTAPVFEIASLALAPWVMSPKCAPVNAVWVAMALDETEADAPMAEIETPAAVPEMAAGLLPEARPFEVVKPTSTVAPETLTPPEFAPPLVASAVFATFWVTPPPEPVPVNAPLVPIAVDETDADAPLTETPALVATPASPPT